MKGSVASLNLKTVSISQKIMFLDLNHKIFATNSRFDVKKDTTGEVQLLFSRGFLLVPTNLYLGTSIEH